MQHHRIIVRRIHARECDALLDEARNEVNVARQAIELSDNQHAAQAARFRKRFGKLGAIRAFAGFDLGISSV
uniref:Uncharacterized protein n=1 Tax=mine drainage metagenome TaxID=410659 RepID=E6PBZ4_9ZZZZ